MENDIERNSVSFHNRARGLLFSLYGDFKNAIASVDRQGNENLFLQLQTEYIGRLKNHLFSIARDILNNMRPGASQNEMNHVLGRFIEDYEIDFMKKVNSL
jgi:hypothetical protein